jgi:hypothetical protein
MKSDIWTPSRIASLAWVLGMLSAAVWFRGAVGVFWALRLCVWPVACIWLSEYLGYAIAPGLTPPAEGPTPGIVFTVLGWIMMFGFSIAVVLRFRNG